MSAVPSDPRRTYVIVLGGSKFPNNPGLDIESLKSSALALRDYFLDPKGFGLPDKDKQLKWLFDEPVTPSDVTREIRQFLLKANDQPVDDQPLDVIVVYLGHGFIDDDKSYRIVTPTYDPYDFGSALSFRDLQRTVKTVALRVRRFYLLDACYSGAALGDTLATDPITHKVVSEVEEESKDEIPQYGTALLCAASRKVEAMAPRTEQYTMFSGALLSVLGDSTIEAPRLTLRALHRLASDLIAKRFTLNPVRPQIHFPEQDDGDLGTVQLFPVRQNRAPAPAGLLDALKPSAFAGDGRLYAVVVGRQRRAGEELSDLQQAVLDAWSGSRRQIVPAVDRWRAAWRTPLVPTGDVNGGFALAELCIESACATKTALQAAVAALCRAEIAVFDLTNWDPVATFLLGIRAVARRGVTLTFKSGREEAMPFNLQLLNMLEPLAGDGKPSPEQIGSKIASGFSELLTLPHYLDLPAYDSVRQLGVDASAYRPIRMTESVLLLCPFSSDYTKNNLGRIKTTLPPRIREHVEKVEKLPEDKPALVRLLNLKTPRLVAQTLFESIRLTDMCVIDWTGANTNVIFEAGVRMAINPLGAVHIIEEKAYNSLRRGSASATLGSLLEQLQPIAYRLGGFDIESPFVGMVQRFQHNVDANAGANGQRETTNFVYEAVGVAIDRRAQPAALPLVTELVRSANLLDTEDQEGGGISPVLFHDVNADLAREAREAAAERRLASWLFITRKYELEQIAAEAELLDAFELLSFQVKRWARRSAQLKVLEEVRTTLDGVRKAVSSVTPSGPLNDEQQAIRLIARARRDKEEAKDLRDVKDVPGAVELLKQTVAALSGSRLASKLEKATDPTKLQKDLAAQLADCYGMLGGNYRRLGQTDDAYSSFQKGVVYEVSAALDVMSSYNIVNSIVMPIESKTLGPEQQLSLIEKAVETIGRQVRGQRRSDRWAWADLAQCQLLLGQLEQALRSYAKVRDLGDEQTIGSIVPVLERLAVVVPSRAGDIKEAIKAMAGGEAAAAGAGA